MPNFQFKEKIDANVQGINVDKAIALVYEHQGYEKDYFKKVENKDELKAVMLGLMDNPNSGKYLADQPYIDFIYNDIAYGDVLKFIDMETPAEILVEENGDFIVFRVYKKLEFEELEVVELLLNIGPIFHLDEDKKTVEQDKTQGWKAGSKMWIDSLADIDGSKCYVIKPFANDGKARTDCFSLIPIKTAREYMKKIKAKHNKLSCDCEHCVKSKEKTKTKKNSRRKKHEV